MNSLQKKQEGERRLKLKDRLKEKGYHLMPLARENGFSEATFYNYFRLQKETGYPMVQRIEAFEQAISRALARHNTFYDSEKLKALLNKKYGGAYNFCLEHRQYKLGFVYHLVSGKAKIKTKKVVEFLRYVGYYES